MVEDIDSRVCFSERKRRLYANRNMNKKQKKTDRLKDNKVVKRVIKSICSSVYVKVRTQDEVRS